MLQLKKGLLVAGILLAGICAALPFRSSQPASQSAMPSGAAPLTLRQRDVPLRVAAQRGPSSRVVYDIDQPLQTQQRPGQAPKVQTPARVQRFAPPPRLAEDYHPLFEDSPSDSQSGSTRVAKLPARPLRAADALDPPPDGEADEGSVEWLRHTIVDGDTLSGLAAHYLGDAARAAEIFGANRDVLSDAGILPLGKVIRIRRTLATTADEGPIRPPQTPTSPLVPIPAGLFGGSAEPAAQISD